MQLNRRSFFKIAGTVGVSSMLPGKLTGSEKLSQQQPLAKQLNPFTRKHTKKHLQKFNRCGYAAPKLDMVRVAIIGVSALH